MDSWIDFQALSQQYPWTLYGWLFLAAVLENLFPPFPGDAVVVFGGYLAGMGKLSPLLTLGAATLGGWVGFMACYAMGKWLGRTWVLHTLGRWVKDEQLIRVEVWMRRHGLWVVVFSRFLSGVRAVVSLAVGLAGLRLWPVALVAALAVLTWNLLLIGAGYQIGAEWPRVLAFLSAYHQGLLLVLALLAGAWLLWRVLRKKIMRK